MSVKGEAHRNSTFEGSGEGGAGVGRVGEEEGERRPDPVTMASHFSVTMGGVCLQRVRTQMVGGGVLRHQKWCLWRSGAMRNRKTIRVFLVPSVSLLLEAAKPVTLPPRAEGG